ncbi:MAG TPA: hypothetical protein VK550_14350 [Polyangiaceae bacterium]|jgi:hypothetical protein|nr:hypothetical protein [Polyangiaceae bacterium]
MKPSGAFAFATLLVTTPILLVACAVETTDGARDEETESVGQAIGGPPPCKAFLSNGQPNPAWPACLSGGPSIPPPSCSGAGICYCVCRWNHRCDQTPSECGALSQCLNGCDQQYPNCPHPGGGYPQSLAACYTGG